MSKKGKILHALAFIVIGIPLSIILHVIFSSIKLIRDVVQ